MAALEEPKPPPAQSVWDAFRQPQSSAAASLESLGRVARAPSDPIYKFNAIQSEADKFRRLPQSAYQPAPPPPAPTRDQAAEQNQHLEEMKALFTALNQTIQNAEEDRKRAERDREEQAVFNKVMAIVAIALSFAALAAPFILYWLEHGWWWEVFRP